MSKKEVVIKAKDDLLKDERIKNSLTYSVLDGTFCASMIGFGESFLSAFAVFLKATNVQLGLLSSLPQMIGSFSQLFSNRLIKLFDSRKKLVCAFALLQGLMYIPIALVFFLGTLKVYHLILFVSIYWLFGMILGPAWNSWMGDIVPENRRGAYFGLRNKITGFATFFSFLIAGYVLQRYGGGTTTQYVGFAIIFLLALISRIISFIFLTKKYEPKYVVVKGSEFSFFDFVSHVRESNYGLFVIFLCLMNFSVYISAPFFTPYMLNYLGMNYFTFTIVIAAATIVKIFSMPVWGRVSDRFGTKKVLSLSSFLMPVVPILWIFSDNIPYLILIQMYSGFVWAGFELASFNFIFDTTSPQKRASCVAYYNVLNGSAVFLGALIGGLMIKYNSVFLSKYFLVFLVSGILRYLVTIALIPKLKEVRQVDGIKYTELFFRVITMMPTMGLVHNIIAFGKHEIEKLEKKGYPKL